MRVAAVVTPRAERKEFVALGAFNVGIGDRRHEGIQLEFLHARLEEHLFRHSTRQFDVLEGLFLLLVWCFTIDIGCGCFIFLICRFLLRNLSFGCTSQAVLVGPRTFGVSQTQPVIIDCETCGRRS